MQEHDNRNNKVPSLERDTPSTSRQRHLEPPYRHQVPIDDLICRFAKMRIDTPPIEKVPQEVLLQIVDNLQWYCYQNTPHGPVFKPTRKDLLNICQTSRQLQAAATTILYRNPYLSTAKSVGCFLFTLTQNPGLVRLVGDLHGPRLIPHVPRLDYAYFNAGDESINAILSSRYYDEDGSLPREYYTPPLDNRVSIQMLEGILRLLPRLKLLAIPQGQLLDGPYTGQIRFEHLKVLSLSVPHHPETSFERCPESYNRRLLSWLEPQLIGARFPVLDCLYICTPTREWRAHFLTGDGNSASNGIPERYVHTLETAPALHSFYYGPRGALRDFGPAEWDLMSLQQPIFDPSKFLALKFNTPGPWDCNYAPTQNWDLGRFLATNGQCLRLLTLDWEIRPGVGYFGPGSDRLTNLNTLTHLNSLTVSMQVLFSCHREFRLKMTDLKEEPITQLSLLFPESLTVLRINEYISGILDDDDWYSEEDLEKRRFCEHSISVYHFIRILRNYWLTVRGDRQLWFKRWYILDGYKHKNRGMHPARSGLSWIMGHGDKDTMVNDYVLVTREPLGEGHDKYDNIAVLREEGRSDLVFMDLESILSLAWA